MKVGRLTDRFQVLSEDDGAAGAGAGASGAAGAGDTSDLIPRAEAKKAFEARDKAKREADELRKRALSDDDLAEYQTLKAQQAKAEEDRLKKAGEFESLKAQQKERHDQIVKDHQKVLAEKDTQYGTLSERFKTTVKLAQFGAATDYFSGSETSKTILDVELGMAYLGKYVHVEDADDDPQGYKVIVKKPNGDTIFGADGNPAPFAEAIGELIKALPNRDRILRGSGKTGSGNSGGSNRGADQVDLNRLTAEQFRDPKIREALKRRAANAGGLQIGPAFDRVPNR
jgi:hypothetical protein